MQFQPFWVRAGAVAFSIAVFLAIVSPWVRAPKRTYTYDDYGNLLSASPPPPRLSDIEVMELYGRAGALASFAGTLAYFGLRRLRSSARSRARSTNGTGTRNREARLESSSTRIGWCSATATSPGAQCLTPWRLGAKASIRS